MVFSSTVFLCAFLPVVLAIYFVLPPKARNCFLFAASLIFYAWGEPKYIVIMLFSTVFDYCNGLILERLDKKSNETGRKIVLAVSVIVNIGLMCFFKYTDFAIESINSIFGASFSLLNIALPIGISFYTFQTLSYTIDVYRRQVNVQHNIINFGMYISMFPQLIAGPIVRYKDIEKQLNSRKIKYDEVLNGFFRFAIGLSKKVLIANQLGALWNEIYQTGGKVTALTAWTGALAFALQIYFDFSGYSDMAIGIGHMLGFSFVENFDYPYMASSITDFWRRWHITLSTWFKEYVYIPLGGNRKGKLRQIINLFIVWFLTGLWHGAGVNFILWGLYFFVWLVLEKLFLAKLLGKLPAIFRHLYTVFVVLFSWVIFACDKTSLLFSYIPSLFGANGFGLAADEGMGVYYLKTYAIMFIIAAIFSTNLFKKLVLKLKAHINAASFNVISTFVCCALLLLCIVFVVGDSYNPFLYFRF